jgi:hypothetical protein
MQLHAVIGRVIDDVGARTPISSACRPRWSGSSQQKIAM